MCASCGLTLWLTRYPTFADAKKTIAPYQGWIQIGLIGSSAVLSTLIFAKLGTWLTDTTRQRRFKKAVHNHLKTLTIQEKAVLSFYLRNGTRTAEWPIDNSVVGALVSRGILYRDGVGNMRAFPTHVTEDVWLEIKRHPELIV